MMKELEPIVATWYAATNRDPLPKEVKKIFFLIKKDFLLLHRRTKVMSTDTKSGHWEGANYIVKNGLWAKVKTRLGL